MKHSYKIYLLILTGVSIVIGLSRSSVRDQHFLTRTSSYSKLAVPDIPSSAIGSIQESLSKHEYHISYDSAKHVYQSPNRQHNLRAYYRPGALAIRNRKDSAGHNFEFRILNKGIFADGVQLEMDEAASEFVHEDNTAEIRYGAVSEQYVNSEAGLRQNFIIQKAPQGTTSLEVQLAVEGATVSDLGNNELKLFPQDAAGNALTYKELKCWDADGNALAAVMTSKDGQISISVDVKGASFPVTIDPIIANGTPANAILVPEVNQTQAWLGGSVSSAGDVNGDGYSDVIVAASKYDNGEVDEGAAWVYYGSASGLNLGNAVMLQGNQTGARFGCFVSTAGDINKDGYSDILVGALLYDKGETNEGAVFVYHGSAAGISTNATLVLEGNQAEANFGNAMGLAGDVNGDGYSDVVIGARAYDNGQINEGVAFVYQGSAQGLTANNPVKIEANQAESMFGFTATGAGDVNGDGYSDIMVGARLFDKGQVDEGAVFIYHGSALGINPNAPALTLESNQASAYLGHAIGTAGDVNGDGYSDIIITANMFDKGQTNEGAAFVHHGSAQGISPVAALTLEMNQAEAQFGSSAASSGDVNGDGYADVIVGAAYYDQGHSNEGAAFVFQGAKTGLGANPVSTLESNKVNAQFGSSVASAGDVNGDGYSDVIVGAIAYDNGHDDEGAVFVWHGGAINENNTVVLTSNNGISFMGVSHSTVGDINGDGFEDVLVGASNYDNGQSAEGVVFVYYGSRQGIQSKPDKMLECNISFAHFGQSVSTAGDINGDGYTDVLIGAKGFSSGPDFVPGAVFIYMGSPLGLQNNAIKLESDDSGSKSGIGTCVTSAGDINGDGYSDIAVSSPYYSGLLIEEGAVFVYLGSSSGIQPNSKKIIKGKGNSNVDMAMSRFGQSISSGDLNGDGFGDLAVGAPEYSNGQGNQGAVFVFYGSVQGLNETPTKIVSNKVEAQLGFSVNCTGDFNGDGFKDLVAGSPYYSNGQEEEGVAFVYYGSPNGVNSAATILEQNQEQSHMGYSVSSAGDVNGDGYSDLLIGSPSYSVGSTTTGVAYLYFGGNNPLESFSKIDYNEPIDPLAGFASFGNKVSGGGDVNGDGYSDFLISDPHPAGKVKLYLGGSYSSIQNNLRLYNTNLTTPINQTQFAQNNFGAGLYAKSFLGGNKGKMVWETKAVGQAFSKGANNIITNSTQSTAAQNAYTNLGLVGTELKNVINKQGASTRVRVRVKYDPVLALTGQTYGPWRYLSSQLGGGGVSPAPEESRIQNEALSAATTSIDLPYIYPNPASDAIYIQAGEPGTLQEVKLFDKSGRIQLQTKTGTSLDIRSLPSGKYTVVITLTDGRRKSYPIIVQK